MKFGNVVALDNVDFRVGHNEVIGLLGDNGAGKTTLAMALIGCYPIESGEVLVNGRKVNFRCARDAQNAGIETNFQELALVDSLSISRNFFLGREITRGSGPIRFLCQKKMDSIVPRFLSEIGLRLERSVHERVGALSGGERQALAVARAFYFRSRLIILDEPTAALDEADTERVLQLVQDARKRGISVVFITHNSHEVFEVADRFVILQNGKNYADLRKEDTDIRNLAKLMIASRLASMREIAAGISHQIRNPLGVMRVSAEMLRDDFKPKKDKENYDRIVQMLIDEIDTLSLVVSNFLDFARMPKLEKTATSIEELIRSSLAAMPLNRFPEIEVRVHVDQPIPTYPLDRSLVSQVIVNLVLNALEASRIGGSVEIRAFMENNRLQLEVQDWGEGIREDLQGQIFTPFFSTKRHGIGLGLAIVHRIVEQHKGAIDCVSVPNHGTTFRVTF